MKTRFTIIWLMLAFYSAGLPSAVGKEFDPRVEKIVNNEILPAYITPSGFKVDASEIKYNENKHYQALEDLAKRKPGSFDDVVRRLFERSISTNYARMQKQHNDKAHPAGNKYRAALLDAFRQVGSIGPGGSAWSQTCMFIPAHVEWLIANPNQRGGDSEAALAKSDEEVIRKLKAMLEKCDMPESNLDPDRMKERTTAFRKISEDMKRIEAVLSESEATAIRNDLAHYF